MENPRPEDIIGLFQPRVVEEYYTQTPHPIQQIALSLNNEELLYGGSAGGGKSSYMLMAALQYCDVPGYSALILRRSWPDLNSPGSILSRFMDWMAGKNVKKKDGGRLWLFPSGAKIQFGYASRPDAARDKFQGAEYQFIGFDEGTQFEDEIYEYLHSRLRKPTIPCLICAGSITRYYSSEGNVRYRHSNNDTTCSHALPDPSSISAYGPAPDGLTIFDVPLRLRTTANPGGLSHQYFKSRFIDAKTREPGTAFIPATLKDNPSLNREEYAKTLSNLSLVDRERLLNGNWEIMDKGNLFQRGDFEFVEDPPLPYEIKSRVRFWDMAASDGKNSDYTAGALCSITHDGRWFIEDIKRVQFLPPQVEKLMRNTAIQDGIDVKVFAEQEPGGSGKSLISHLKRNVMAGFQFEGIRSTGSKTARAGSLVSQVSDKNVFVVQAKWNLDFLDEVTTFPTGLHDDQVDAVASAFVAMTGGSRRPLRLIV